MRFKFFRQLESSDCGVACLKMVAEFYGKAIDRGHLKGLMNVGKMGVSMDSIIHAANEIGFETRPVSLSYEQLSKDVPLPAILYWKESHFVVIYKINKVAFIADPAFGKIQLKQDEFIKLWKVDSREEGVALLLLPNPDATLPEYTKSTEIDYLFKYLKPSIRSLIVVSVLVIIIASISFIYPYINKELIDNGINDNNVKIIYYLIIAQGLALTTSTIMRMIQSWLFLRIRIDFGLSSLVSFLHKLIKMPLAFYENRLPSDILQRIFDNKEIESFISEQTIQFIISIFSFIVFMIILAKYSFLIALIFFIGTLFSATWVSILNRRRKFLNYERFDLSTTNKNLLLEIIEGISDIKVGNSESSKVETWRKTQNRLFDVDKKSLKLNNIQEFGTNYITEIKNTIVLCISALAVVSHQMSLGTLLAISFIIGQLNVPLNYFVTFIYNLQDAKISISRLHDIYTTRSEDENKRGGNKVISSDDTMTSNNDIRLNKVSFGFGYFKSSDVLKDITINIMANSTTAIVGESGSGKTTLVKLLAMFYTPRSGQIFYGNTDITQYSPAAWRRKISIVFQDGYLFSDTIKNNIIMDMKFNPKVLENVIDKCCLKEVIDRIPKGIETIVGQSGVGLSKGQVQRILIARAMYKDPEILILDEATSSLDAINERVIHQNIYDTFKGKTVIIIAHRLSTVKNADNIIVLNNGKIIEQGSHELLISQKGGYYNLVKNQLQLSM